MVSMKDIAKRCGVSVATVSKALNGHSDIGTATKEKIMAVAKEMGYFPNSSARALKTRRTYNLGVLFVDEARNGLKQDYFSGVLDSFKVTAESRGYDITFISCNKENVNRMSYLEHSRYRGVDGVVIACVDFEDPEVVELIESDMPVVTIDHVFNNCPAVVSDNNGGIDELVRYVCSQGHKKIAYIYGNENFVTGKRLTSFKNTMQALGMDIKSDYMQCGHYRDTDDSYKLTKQLLDMKERPSCIIYPDDYAAIGGINAIREEGLSIPEDVSIAGYDGIDIAKVMSPRLTTIEQDTTKIGRVAAERLIDLIERPKEIVMEWVSVAGMLIKGETVARI